MREVLDQESEAFAEPVPEQASFQLYFVLVCARVLTLVMPRHSCSGEPYLICSCPCRLLGVPVRLQNKIFRVWHEFMEAAINDDKVSGKYQECIADIAAGNTATLEGEEVLYQNKRSNMSTNLSKVLVRVLTVLCAADSNDTMLNCIAHAGADGPGDTMAKGCGITCHG